MLDVNKILKKASSTIKPTFKAWDQVFDFSKIPESQGHTNSRNKTNSDDCLGSWHGPDGRGRNEFGT